MALIPIQSRPRVQQTQSAKKGGGQFGQIGGLLAGAAIGGLSAATGGAAIPAIAAGALGGAGTGASVGGLLGQSVAPGQSAEFQRVDPKRMSTVEIGGMSQQLMASLNALENYPDLAAIYGKPLTQAYMNTQIAMKNKDMLGGGMA